MALIKLSGVLCAAPALQARAPYFYLEFCSDMSTTPALARRLSHIQPFRVMEVLERAAELTSAGHDVVHFEVGEPDFTTAPAIVAAGQAALEAGHTHYTAATGLPELREKIARHYLSMNLAVAPERIVVTAGASAGLLLLNTLLLNPGDGLLITDPGYPCNEVFALTVGAVPQPMTVAQAHGFQPTLDQVQRSWQGNTRGALLASPANPTGTMLTASSLAAIAADIKQRGGFLILDEIYQGLVPVPPYPSALAITEDLFVLNSFSKFFGMTGWRLGWVVVPQNCIEAITRLAQNLFICPSAPAQYAALAAFDGPAMAVHEARAATFAARGELLSRGLKALGFQIPVAPDGAFYLYVDVTHTGLSSDEFCARLLNEFHVAVTPGHDFGMADPGRYVRFAYTTSEDAIRVGLERIAQAVKHMGVQ